MFMTKKIFSAELTEDVLSRFTEYVADRRYVKYRAVEAGMKLFMALSPETQVALMKGDVTDDSVRAFLNKEVAGKGLDSYNERFRYGIDNYAVFWEGCELPYFGEDAEFCELIGQQFGRVEDALEASLRLFIETEGMSMAKLKLWEAVQTFMHHDFAKLNAVIFRVLGEELGAESKMFNKETARLAEILTRDSLKKSKAPKQKKVRHSPKAG